MSSRANPGSLPARLMHLRVDASFLTLFPSLILCATVTNRNKRKFSQNLLAKVSFSLSPIVSLSYLPARSTRAGRFL